MVNYSMIEKAILGSMLTAEQYDNNELLHKGLKVLDPVDFSDPVNRSIYQAIKETAACGSVDVVTVSSRIPQDQIVALMDAASTAGLSGNFDQYCSDLREERKRRDTIAFHKAAAQKAANGASGTELLDDMQRYLDKEKTIGLADVKPITGEDIANVIVDLQEARQITPTGFYRLDGYIKGIGSGRLIVVGGRPSMGKSTFMMNIATYVALFGGGNPVAYITIEDSKKSLIKRMAFCLARCKEEDIERKDGNACQRVVDATQKIEASKSLYIREGGASLQNIIDYAWKVKRAAGRLSLIVIDYLGLITPAITGNKSATLTQQIGEITRGLKQLSIDTDTTIILGCQVNRNAASRSDNDYPQLSELRDSGATEQDADIVLFPIHDIENETDRAGVKIAKNRNGETGVVNLKWCAGQYRFESNG